MLCCIYPAYELETGLRPDPSRLHGAAKSGCSLQPLTVNHVPACAKYRLLVSNCQDLNTESFMKFDGDALTYLIYCVEMNRARVGVEWLTRTC